MVERNVNKWKLEDPKKILGYPVQISLSFTKYPHNYDYKHFLVNAYTIFIPLCDTNIGQPQ